MIKLTIENKDNVSQIELQDGDTITLNYNDGDLSVNQCSTKNSEMNIAQGSGCIAKQTTVTQQTIRVKATSVLHQGTCLPIYSNAKITIKGKQ